MGRGSYAVSCAPPRLPIGYGKGSVRNSAETTPELPSSPTVEPSRLPGPPPNSAMPGCRWLACSRLLDGSRIPGGSIDRCSRSRRMSRTSTACRCHSTRPLGCSTHDSTNEGSRNGLASLSPIASGWHRRHCSWYMRSSTPSSRQGWTPRCGVRRVRCGVQLPKRCPSLKRRWRYSRTFRDSDFSTRHLW